MQKSQAIQDASWHFLRSQHSEYSLILPYNGVLVEPLAVESQHLFDDITHAAPSARMDGDIVGDFLDLHGGVGWTGGHTGTL